MLEEYKFQCYSCGAIFKEKLENGKCPCCGSSDDIRPFDDEGSFYWKPTGGEKK